MYNSFGNTFTIEVRQEVDQVAEFASADRGLAGKTLSPGISQILKQERPILSNPL